MYYARIKDNAGKDYLEVALSDYALITDPLLNKGISNLLPSLNEIREMSFQVGLAVAKEAIASGSAASCADVELEIKVREKMWMPAYLPYEKARVLTE